ncbi:glycosyltransferase family 2 protein [Streptomyces sp. NPDC057509]|uniref:glycosyltransferase family 2 protein n=1 Tax=Streptomyces sp. NPDC057509 TaxID=3346152 RepID=UPI003692A91A
MLVSLIIPSFNSRNALEVCLTSLNHQRLGPADSLEIVVVDDGSDDGTRSMVENFSCKFPLRCIHKPRTPESGRSAARNTAIEAATGDLVVMIDADEVVPPTCVAEHIRYHEHRPDLVVLGPRGYFAEGHIDLERLGSEFTFDALPPVIGGDSRGGVLAKLSHNLNNMATCWHYLFSCNASVRREHLSAVGGFEESFTGWGLEDSELGYRLRQRGLAFAYNPQAVLYHQHAQVLDKDMYADWRVNLSHFTTLHPAPEVAAQWVLDRSFDPATTDLSWVECCLRFEYAARAFEGRLPTTTPYRLIEVAEADVERARAELPGLARQSPLLLIDHTGDGELAALAQCVETPHDLVYFPRPGAEERTRILAAHPHTAEKPGTS